MGASYPKPDGQKVTRHAPQFGWTNLPAEGRKGKAPTLPAVRHWTEFTLGWWRDLWATPQATQWDEDNPELIRLALLHETIWSSDAEKGPSPGILSEMRQIEDRFGLNPKAMLQLRWRIDEAPVPASTRAPSKTKMTRRDNVMRLVTNGNEEEA